MSVLMPKTLAKKKSGYKRKRIDCNESFSNDVDVDIFLESCKLDDKDKTDIRAALNDENINIYDLFENLWQNQSKSQSLEPISHVTNKRENFSVRSDKKQQRERNLEAKVNNIKENYNNMVKLNAVLTAEINEIENRLNGYRNKSIEYDAIQKMMNDNVKKWDIISDKCREFMSADNKQPKLLTEIDLLTKMFMEKEKSVQLSQELNNQYESKIKRLEMEIKKMNILSLNNQII